MSSVRGLCSEHTIMSPATAMPLMGTSGTVVGFTPGPFNIATVPSSSTKFTEDESTTVRRERWQHKLLGNVTTVTMSSSPAALAAFTPADFATSGALTMLTSGWLAWRSEDENL